DTDRPLGNGIPLETADLPDNGLGGAPNVMQFNYSSGRNGPVVLKFYNYSPADVTFSLDDSGLQLSNGTVVPLLLALGSTGTATQVAGVDCAYALGMSLFVARTDDPTGQPMFQVTGPCAGGEFSDMATGNVQQKTANGWLQWVKAANRVDYDDGTSVWYGCQNGIVEVPRIAAVPC
ncbi:MAG: hypothetical protein ACRDF8_10320, partial [Chloroflexota bacterium]